MKDDFWGLEEKILGDDKTRHLDRDFEEAYDGKDFEFEEKKERRVWKFYLIIIFLLLTLFLRAFSLQVVQGKHYRYLAEGNRIRQKQVDAPRGLIYDSKGNLLTENQPQFILSIYPQDIPEADQEKNKIAQTFYNQLGLDVKEMLLVLNLVSKYVPSTKEKRDKFAEDLSKKILVDKNTVMEKMKVYKKSFDPLVFAENIDREKAIVLKEKFNEYPCVAIEEKLNRKYVADAGLSHILGYIGKINNEELELDSDYSLTDLKGKTGIESYYESYLKGEKGKQQVEVDATGKIVKVLAQKSSVAGDSLELSIDYDFQKKMFNTLSRFMAESGSRASVGIAMNPQTGEILSSVSLPSYDNNIFTLKSSQEFSKQYSSIIDDPGKPLLHRAIAGVYPPGSTIKPLVASAGLAEGNISQNTSIFDPGEILVPNQYNPEVVYRFPDWKPEGHGVVNVYNAIAQSCDVFFYAVGGGWKEIKGLGSKKLEEYYRLFGFGAKTGVDLPSEQVGLVPTPDWKQKVKKEPWYQGDTYHISIGQGDLLTTPLQLVNSISTIANGGNLMTPHFVNKIIDVRGKTVKEQKTLVKKKSIISKDIIKIVKDGMRQTVTSGTARSLKDFGIEIAGKTGTAQFENNTSLHSWFVSFAPFDNPEIAMVVLFEGGGEGNEVALPATNELFNHYFFNR